MSWDHSGEAAELLRRAAKEPLVPHGERRRGPFLDRAAIQTRLPHRDPFLFVDEVTRLDLERGIVVARYDLNRAAAVLAGHFPQRPVWPGVLQVEAIAQAGAILHLAQAQEPALADMALTHILGARFVRAVTPGDDLEIIAQVLADGLLVTIVGQCLQYDAVCSAAAVAIL